ncbi:MAG: MBL fold metallo-hydrolase [Bacteroidetes bacterium]|nr:MBL fold metallo-hydrolase [Bacteroidota bacterium]
MKIKFCGANKSVTGSQHLLEINGRRLLLDCGLFQGRRVEAFERNHGFLYEPQGVDAMVLSHAHIDHSGNIPNLVKQGFKGPIYATPPTVDLCKVMLLDSAHIQERDVEYLNKRLAKRGEILKEPLYTVAEAQACLDLFRGIGYGKTFEPVPGARVTFFNAGHMFGSAMLLIEVSEGSKSMRFAFSGDLGRSNLPIIEDPDQITYVDALICESTYGNKLHDPAREIQGDLVEVIKQAVDRNGKIIVPAFSVERTQEIVYHLNKLYERKLVPAIPVFVDSPLAVNVTDVFVKHPEYYDAEATYLLSNNDNPFVFQGLHYITKVEESKKLNFRSGPCIIISASGMCEAGRILHHLANNIEDSSTTVLIVGFMAEHTLGRKLVDRHETVRIFGEEYKLNARVVKLNSFSGHADKADLMAFCGNIGRQAQIFLVHGEEQQSLAFKESLKAEGFSHVSIPNRADEITL